MVIAFAGRRIDAPSAKDVRFPAANVPVVRERIRAVLSECRATVMVSSAACGADLIALEVAGEQQIRRIIVLPGGRARFRETSVVDRGSEWGPIYDRVVDAVDANGDLRVLGLPADGLAEYLGTNDEILKSAERLAEQDETAQGVVAIVVWNGQSRGAADVTEAFVASARERRLRVIELSTV